MLAEAWLMRRSAALTFAAAALLWGCSGRVVGDSSKVTNSGPASTGTTDDAGSDASPASAVAVGNGRSGLDPGATTLVGDSSIEAPSNPVDAAQVNSGDLDAGGGCSSLTFVDPTGAAPLDGQSICSRRTPDAFHDCPAGIGQSASSVIGPEGGMVTLEGQQGPVSGVPFSISIPPHALSASTAITVTELSTPPPEGFADWSPLYRIDPVDLQLAAPATLTIPFSNDCCEPGTACESSFSRAMGLFWSGQDTCVLERLPSSYVNAGVEQGSTTRLGFAIVGFADLGSDPYCQ
jgi:hypothetical protein